MTAFELAVHDVCGLNVAAHVRPDRIELCTGLSTGGLTPSMGLIQTALRTDLPIHVLIRPRAGDFTYNSDEQDLIVRDSRLALAAGAAGVVVGATTGGMIDRTLISRVLDAASGREITFHRAFDTLADRPAALEELVDLGVTRVLTSGGAGRATDALPELEGLAAQAGPRIQIMAGAGLTSANASQIAATGVHAVHGSAKRHTAGPTLFGGYDTTDGAEASAILAVVKGRA